MQIPVLVESKNGHFIATVAGMPDCQAEGTTRDNAVEALRKSVRQHMDQGQLVFIELEPKGVHALAGILKDDPWVDEILEETYQYRDELRKQEFGE
jgi:hypothetical protein